MAEAKAWREISSEMREEANKNPREKRYVVLRAFNYLPKLGGAYYYSAYVRYEVHLKFYETSVAGGRYFAGLDKYPEFFVSEGTEMVGEGVNIAHTIHREIQLGGEEVLTFLLSGLDPRFDARHIVMPLTEDDRADLMIMEDYKDLEARQKIIDVQYKEPK